MRIKKWEKYYWTIVLCLLMGLLIWIILQEKGFEVVINEKKKNLSKTNSFLIWGAILLFNSLFIWFVVKFMFLRSNNFVCKICHKEFGVAYETEKSLCKLCFEKSIIKNHCNDNH